MDHHSVRQHSNQLQGHVIETFWSGTDIPCSLSVLCNGRRVLIEFWAKDLREPLNNPRPSKLETEFLKLLSAADESDDEDDECPAESPEDALYDWILEPFQPLFRRLLLSAPPQIKTLWDSLNPPLQSYTLRSSQSRLKAIPHPTQPKSLYTLTLPTNMISNLPPAARSTPLPLIKPQDLRIAPASGSRPDPNVVLYNNKPAYFKRISRGAEDSVITEIASLVQIKRLNLGNIRTPHLLALVKDEGFGTNHLIGILLTLVDSRGDMESLASKAPASLKQAWFRDIAHVVHIFHSHNLLWGDVKPENVLIDRLQKAWLIDFGGGTTPGWIDEELEGTMEGDLQGLKKIQEFLGLQGSGGRERVTKAPTSQNSPAKLTSREPSPSVRGDRESERKAVPSDRVRGRGGARDRSGSPRYGSSARENYGNGRRERRGSMESARTRSERRDQI